MGFRFRKSINLGGGVRLNVSKRGVGVSAGVKGFRVGVGPNGVRTTASIPGTGISYVSTTNLKNSKQNTRTGNVTTQEAGNISSNIVKNPFFPSSHPKELRSNHYNTQTALGILGFILILIGLSQPFALIPASFCMYALFGWRKHTDPFISSYKKALTAYNKKLYNECITELDNVLCHPNANPNLKLVKAECLQYTGASDKTYELLKSYFQNSNLVSFSASDYWEYKILFIELAIDHKDYDMAFSIVNTLPDEKISNFDFTVWKGYIKGLCFLGKEQYEIALECFKQAVGRKRSMDFPFIDCHYYIGTIYSKLGKHGYAKKKFERVYAADPAYQNISEIIDAINNDADIDIKIQ